MKHIIKAVFTLTLFSLIDRTLGFAFKIYLSRELGSISLGIYQVALSVFFVLLTFTTSGIPLIVSKMTAVFKGKNNPKIQGKILVSGLVISISFASIICLVLLVFSAPISGLFASADSMTVLILLLPAVMFSAVYGAFKGGLWGNEYHMTLAVIELIEQLTRICACVLLILFGLNKLKVTAISLSIACGVTMVCCIICYFKYKGKLSSPKGYLLPVLNQSLPITLVRASKTFVTMLVSLAIPFLLINTGLSNAEALTIFGESVGMAMPFLFLPMTIIGSLAYVLIPTLAKAFASSNHASVSTQITGGIKFASIIACMVVPIYYALGTSIGELIYDNVQAGAFLSFSAWLLIPISLEGIVSSMMNSLDLQKQSFVNYLISSLVMFAILFGSGQNFTINVFSIAFGINLTLSLLLDIIAIKRKTKISLSFIVPLVKCIAMIFPSAFISSCMHCILTSLPLWLNLTLSSVSGVLFYVLAGLIFGTINKADFIFTKTTQNSKAKTLANSNNKAYTKDTKI